MINTSHIDKADEKEKSVGSDNRCPDYDDECILVKDHLQCYLGCPIKCANGVTIETGIAKGYCPFIHTNN